MKNVHQNTPTVHKTQRHWLFPLFSTRAMWRDDISTNGLTFGTLSFSSSLREVRQSYRKSTYGHLQELKYLPGLRNGKKVPTREELGVSVHWETVQSTCHTLIHAAHSEWLNYVVTNWKILPDPNPNRSSGQEDNVLHGKEDRSGESGISACKQILLGKMGCVINVSSKIEWGWRFSTH